MVRHGSESGISFVEGGREDGATWTLDGLGAFSSTCTKDSTMW